MHIYIYIHTLKEDEGKRLETETERLVIVISSPLWQQISDNDLEEIRLDTPLMNFIHNHVRHI